MDHLTVRADDSVTSDAYARFSQLDNVTNRLSLTATGTVIPDQLFLNVSAFATPAILNRVQAISPNGGPVPTISDNDTYGYSVQPNYVFRFDNYATSTTSLRQGGFFVSAAPASGNSPLVVQAQNTNSVNATEKIASGSYFSDMQWSLSGIYNKNNQKTGSQTQTQGTAEIDYQIDHSLAVFGTGGYSGFTATVPLNKNLSGPAGTLGLRLSNGPMFEVMAQGGVQNNLPTYVASLLWQITAMTTLTGSLTNSVSSPQGEILNNLSALAGSGPNAISNIGAGASPAIDQVSSTLAGNENPATTSQVSTTSPIPAQGLALDASINNSRTGTLSLMHQSERTQYSLTLTANTRDNLGGAIALPNQRTSLYEATVLAQRELRMDLTGHVSSSFSYANEAGGHDRIVTVEAGLSYALSKTLNIYLLDQYLYREIHGEVNVTSTTLSEDLAVIGLRRSF